jgi:hypothetical protein
VIVSYKWAICGEESNALIPVVTRDEEKVRKMIHHPLRIHLACTLPKARLAELDRIRSDPGARPQLCWFLTLAQDLPLLCLVWQYKIHACPQAGGTGESVYVRTVPGRDVKLWTHDKPKSFGTPSITLKLRSTDFRNMTAQRQHALLEPFNKLTGDKPTFMVEGEVVDTLHISQISAVVSPDVYWPSARLWSAHETWFCLKALADDLLRRGYEMQAHQRYRSLVATSANITETIDRDESPPGSPFYEASLAFQVLIADLILTLGWLELRLRRTGLLTFVRQKIDILFQGDEELRLRLSPEALNGATALMPLLCIYHHHHLGLLKREILDLFNKETYKDKDLDKYLKHDLALLEKLSGGRDRPIFPSDMPLERISASVLPARTFNSTVYGMAPRRPAAVVGWQDTAHLKNLTDKDKKAINDLQKSSGFSVTNF